MTLDAHYVTTVDLSPYLVSKDDGTPLSGGTIEFWKDDDRNVPKTVYQLTGAPPNYTYTALSNPVDISGVGTIEDDSNANVALYYYPYDSTGTEIELYYVVVKDSNGVVQLTREAWPNISAENSPALTPNNPIANQLSNPQFVDVLFTPVSSYTITAPADVLTRYTIAPDWVLEVTTAGGAANVGLSQVPVAGSSQYPTNPAYYLQIVGGANISKLQLKQRLAHNPDIWSPRSGGQNGYIATNLTLIDNAAVNVFYMPSTGTPQLLLSANNSSGIPKAFNNTTQLTAASNPDNADTGYVDIVIDLPVGSTTKITSLQVVGLESLIEDVVYVQDPVNRQQDQLFHYYEEPLKYKPLESYLVGWDFATNPAQALGSTVAAFATGAGTSNYVWDQTIAFQSANSGLTFSRGATGSLKVTAASPGQFALVQYVDLPTARQLLLGRLSVNVSAVTSVTAGVVGTVKLYYTTGASLPDMTTNKSLVLTLNASGAPATFNGTWPEVPHVGALDSTFKVDVNTTTDFNDYAFSGWDMAGAAEVETANYVAIVVGFASMTTSDYIEFNSISLVPGDVATRPAPKTPGQVLFECQRYYETSYLPDTVPGTSAQHGGAIVAAQGATNSVFNPPSGGSSNITFGVLPFYLGYKNEKRAAPTNTYYSDQSGTAAKFYGHLYFTGTIRAEGDLNISGWIAYYTGLKGVGFTPNTDTLDLNYPSAYTANVGQTWISFHYASDARLGIV